MRRNQFSRRSVAALLSAGIALVAAIALAASPLRAQEGRVRITSPASGAVVHPGDTVVISVAADLSIEKLALIGEHPLGIGQVIAGGAPGVVARGAGSARPLQFTLKIPADIDPGAYHVTAIGTNSSGDVESEAITLQVEKAQPPQRLWAEPGSIQFTRIGDQIPVRVLGAFSDGTKNELTRSVSTSYTSSNPRIATVNKEGTVTAVSPGKTTISIASGTLHYSIPVDVE